MSKVVICIPCYNSREKLERLLDSIVIQEFKDFEVIITDDSDNDRIKDLVDRYSKINIKYYKNQMKSGVSGNTNQALKLAGKTNADYIKIMYHDDCFSSSDSLEKMVDALENNKTAIMAFSNTYEVGENVNYERRISDRQIEKIKENIFNLAYANIIGAPSAMIVRMNDLLMDEMLTWFVDVEWYIRILGRCKNFVFINEPLVTIGISDTQVTRECVNDPALILGENIYLYRKYQELHCEGYMNLILSQAEKVIYQCNLYQISRDRINIYIYGAGEIGKKCADFLVKNNIVYKAFIVSNGKRCETILDGHGVMEFDEYLMGEKEKKSVIILALSEKNRAEVIGKIESLGVRYIIWK